ncbi:DUF2460 domain-containing protein [Phaeospirillum tilakii]|uniref:DUF2460 domain-containing protein n=1 Tax=Phaeospirillum tilakii TaxID=741673 RepID=A0ABW5CF41_9PROT
MSNALFPSLPGLTWDIKRSPEFSTTIVKGADGGETRIGNWVYPLWHWTLTYELLRDDATDELRTLLGFFLARQGRLDDFLLRDPSDCAVSGQLLGTGDGVTTTFQAVRGLGGFVEPVKALWGSQAVYVAGAKQLSGWTVSDSGLFTFASAPAPGAAITADLSYCWRVRFDLDQAEFNQFARNLWDLQTCTLVSVR